MTGAYTFQAMSALLRQGRVIAMPSWLFTAAALGWLVLATVACSAVAAAAYVAAGIVVGGGMVQAWYALRVGFDAELLAALAPHSAVEDSAALVDATLAELGVVDPRPTARDWPARWRGARGLLRKQTFCVLLQAAAFVVMLILGDSATCWNG